MFGFRLPQNFDFPYSAAGFRDFWRRWHITLSVWLRDHLYIPLGGNRHGPVRMYLALFVTMLLGGLWHGAHWNFVIWGGMHGLLLVVERQIPPGWQRERVFAIAYRVWTLLAVAGLWVFFRAGSYDDGFWRSLLIYERIFTMAPGSVSESAVRLVGASVLGLILVSLREDFVRMRFQRLSVPALGALGALGTLGILLFSPGSSGFIYFVF